MTPPLSGPVEWDPSQIGRLYTEYFKSSRHWLVKTLALHEETQLCTQLESAGIGSISLVRLSHRSLSLARWFFKEKDPLTQERLKKADLELEPWAGKVYFFDKFEMYHFLHMQSVCRALHENKSLIIEFNKVAPPLSSQLCSDLVRHTLHLPRDTPIGTQEVRVALLSALFNPIRQSVGSCFATAPAILIQREQIATMLSDLIELLIFGRIRKTIQGEDYKVPLSLSFGEEGIRSLIGQRQKATLLNNVLLSRSFIGSGVLKDQKDLNFLINSVEIEPYQRDVKGFIDDLLREKWNLYGPDVDDLIERLKYRKQLTPFQSPQLQEKYKRVEEFLSDQREVERHWIAYFCHPINKSWEFSLASFTDYEVNAFKYNMIVAIGLDPGDSGGIGEVVYRYLDARLQQKNEELREYSEEAERTLHQLNTAQALLGNASDYDRARRLKAEADVLMNHLRHLEDEISSLKEDTEHNAEFLQFLISEYESLFKLYFQEIYDPEVMTSSDLLFIEDSPAGFRLVYKYGRSEPSVWQPIRLAGEYLECLKDFFYRVEEIIVQHTEWEKGKEELTQITRSIVERIDEEIFLKSAMERVANSKLNATHKTPWSYISGGTLESLVKCYYTRETALTRELSHPHSEQELCQAWIEIMKEHSEIQKEAFHTNPLRGLLAQSPTHAFLLTPGFESFQQAWNERGFTYTWVRDEIILPAQNFYSTLSLKREEQQFLLERFTSELQLYLPEGLAGQFALPNEANLKELEASIIKLFESLKIPMSKTQLRPQIHSFLARMLPLYSSQEAQELAKKLFEHIDFKPATSNQIIPYCDLERWLHYYKNLAGLDLCVDQALRDLGHGCVRFLTVADTNWLTYFFVFRVNPVTGELELWRSTLDGLYATPMADWKVHFGEEAKGWMIFTKPAEYQAGISMKETLHRDFKKI